MMLQMLWGRLGVRGEGFCANLVLPPWSGKKERPVLERLCVCKFEFTEAKKKQQQQFLHQKQTRLRANLIDFHQYFSGGERRNELIVGLVSSGLEGFE